MELSEKVRDKIHSIIDVVLGKSYFKLIDKERQPLENPLVISSTEKSS